MHAWGRTLEDMETLVKGRPWYFWKAFGLWNTRSGGVRPWNLIDSILYIWHNDHSNGAFGFDLKKADIERWQTLLESFVIPLTFLYMLFLLFVLPLCLSLLNEEAGGEEGVGNDNVYKKKVD